MRVIEDYYGELPFPLTKGQDIFLRKFTTGTGHWSLVGDAGSGKTTIMQVLQAYYGNGIVFCATSGVANQNLPNGMGSGTAHSLLSLPRTMVPEVGSIKISSKCQAILGSSDRVKIICIDEAYTLHADNLYAIQKMVARLNKKSSKRKERNIRILFVGDCLQNLAIAKPEEKAHMKAKYGHFLLFKNRVWEEMKVSTYVLTEVKRQEDPVFKAILEVLRYGQEHRYPRALAWLNQRYNPDYDRGNLLLAPTNKIVDAANQRSLDSNPNPLMRSDAQVWGKYDMKDCPAETTLYLKKGAPVITLVNDEEGRYFNGSYGHVTGFFPEGVGVKFVGSGETHYIDVYQFTEEEPYVVEETNEEGVVVEVVKKKVIGGANQYAIKLASAYSISRAQGKTFGCPVTIDVGDTGLYTKKFFGDFGCGSLFVGISRCRRIEDLTLARPILPEHIKVCRESVAYWEETVAKQKLEESLLNERQ